MSAIIGMAGEGPPGAAPKRGRTKGSAASAAISGQPSGRPSHNCGQGSDDRVELANFCPAAAFLTPRCSHTMMMACCVRPAGNGEVAMSSTLNPARFKLDLALSEFSKARWAAEPSVDAPLQPTDLDLVASTPSSLGKQTSFALARFLITFCSGVAATLAWQSYGGAARETVASWSPHLGWLAPPPAPGGASPDQLVAMSRGLAVMRQDVDKLAADITKLQAIQQGSLDRSSASPPSPAVAPVRKPVSQPPATVRAPPTR